jgi:sarcosine oxidase delta subunit
MERFNEDFFEWISCPYCGNSDTDELSFSVRAESVGVHCNECENSDFYDRL